MKITKLDRKKFRIRNKVKKVSSKDRYRLSVNRSIKNISAQIIDDSKNITILPHSISLAGFLIRSNFMENY